jgi:hypothetical protein
MEAKLKAEELFNKYKPICAGYNGGQSNKYFSKQAALIAVQEIINANPHSNPLNTDVYSTMDYWQEVKQEINNL